MKHRITLKVGMDKTRDKDDEIHLDMDSDQASNGSRHSHQEAQGIAIQVQKGIRR